MSDEELIAEDKYLEQLWNNIRSGEGGGGSPGEWIWERSEEIANELSRRFSPMTPAPEQPARRVSDEKLDQWQSVCREPRHNNESVAHLRARQEHSSIALWHFDTVLADLQDERVAHTAIRTALAELEAKLREREEEIERLKARLGGMEAILATEKRVSGMTAGQWMIVADHETIRADRAEAELARRNAPDEAMVRDWLCDVITEARDQKDDAEYELTEREVVENAMIRFRSLAARLTEPDATRGAE